VQLEITLCRSILFPQSNIRLPAIEKLKQKQFHCSGWKDPDPHSRCRLQGAGFKVQASRCRLLAAAYVEVLESAGRDRKTAGVFCISAATQEG